jgi:hypothetical protein
MRTTKGSERGTTAPAGDGTVSPDMARTDAGTRGMAAPRSALGTPGQRLPVPPRERKPALAALAVLLILGGALASAYLVIASGNQVSAVRIREPVAAGQKIPLTAMEEVQISANTGLEYVPWADRQKFTQAHAVVNLVRGTLLTGGMAAPPGSNPAAQGRVVVGLALKPGQVPPGGLDSGDQVSVYAVGGQGGAGSIPAGTLLAEQAFVYEVARPGEDDLQSDVVQISVAVPAEQAPQVTQAASAGAAAVALIPPGGQPPPNTGEQPPAPPAQEGQGRDETSEPKPNGQGGNGNGQGGGGGQPGRPGGES